MEISYTWRGVKHLIVVNQDEAILYVAGKPALIPVTIAGVPTTDILTTLAERADVWQGPETLRALRTLAARELPAEPTARDYDRLFSKFKREGNSRARREYADALR